MSAAVRQAWVAGVSRVAPRFEGKAHMHTPTVKSRLHFLSCFAGCLLPRSVLVWAVLPSCHNLVSLPAPPVSPGRDRRQVFVSGASAAPARRVAVGQVLCGMTSLIPVESRRDVCSSRTSGPVIGGAVLFYAAGFFYTAAVTAAAAAAAAAAALGVAATIHLVPELKKEMKNIAETLNKSLCLWREGRREARRSRYSRVAMCWDEFSNVLT
ncbi:hypothetical protein E2C01_076175 [Portunus trituberculatus]|uniref:Uncharacterized protein n=1 Tax=Portunus trituberculatus TaxID=210409 RepID=A0A5B7I805_PORTR|nr:hypothetical protein [Portunus trituberculatus]